MLAEGACWCQGKGRNKCLTWGCRFRAGAAAAAVTLYPSEGDPRQTGAPAFACIADARPTRQRRFDFTPALFPPPRISL